MKDFTDRRKYKRVEGFFEVFVNFNPEAPDKFYCDSVDISEGGMKIRTPRPLQDRNHAILTFNLPDYPTEITAQVVVAWASATPKEDGYYESGIKFLLLNNAEKEAIRNYVARYTEKTI